MYFSGIAVGMLVRSVFRDRDGFQEKTPAEQSVTSSGLLPGGCGHQVRLCDVGCFHHLGISRSDSSQAILAAIDAHMPFDFAIAGLSSSSVISRTVIRNSELDSASMTNSFQLQIASGHNNEDRRIRSRSRMVDRRTGRFL